MNEHDRQPDATDLRAAEKFAEALRQTHNQRVFVPPQVDETILARARQHLAAIAPQKHDWQPLTWWGALAASLALVAGWWFRPDKPPLTTTEKAAVLPGDINGDQQVDVLDALAMSQRIEQGTANGLSDLNGDGVIDQRDAEWIARQAVRLEKRGGV